MPGIISNYKCNLEVINNPENSGIFYYLVLFHKVKQLIKQAYHDNAVHYLSPFELTGVSFQNLYLDWSWLRQIEIGAAFHCEYDCLCEEQLEKRSSYPCFSL